MATNQSRKTIILQSVLFNFWLEITKKSYKCLLFSFVTVTFSKRFILVYEAVSSPWLTSCAAWLSQNNEDISFYRNNQLL